MCKEEREHEDRYPGKLGIRVGRCLQTWGTADGNYLPTC